MSFIPPSRGMVDREAYGGREVEAELVTEHYAETHPGDGIPYDAAGKRQGLLRRLRNVLGGQRDEE